jgi:hypothetical protein
MHRNKIIIVVAVLTLWLTSCIKSYEPVIESKDASKYVVSGQVSTGDQVQRVNISMTSSIGKPKYIPVTNCSVTIFDDKGNAYPASDTEDGNYMFYVPETAQVAGSRFKVIIVTQDGDSIVSDFDQMQNCPDVDSVYYIVKKLPTANPEKFVHGIQFYVNLNAENTNCRNYRWDATETWEYHSTWPREWYYDGEIHHIWPPDYSRMVCWRTALVQSIFTLSTQNLGENKYTLFPLHYVDNYYSPRLVYGYSLLIRQYALSEEAYTYWDKLRINSSEQGGLYEKQPLAIKGNMHDITNPDQLVLGFFGASAVKSKRIFVQNVPDLILEYDPACVPSVPLKKGFADIDPRDYPAYMYGDVSGFQMRVLDTECVDCLSVGGTTVKPDFWPY